MTADGGTELVRRTGVTMRPDPARTVGLIFLPGQELTGSGESRSSAVLGRVLNLSDEQVGAELAATAAAFADRHHDLAALWEAHFELLAHRLGEATHLSTERRLLIGAYFTREYAVEGAALFNPSMVEHPDQSGLAAGATRFVMSLRAVGEGHLSSIEWRTGIIDAADDVVLDPPPTRTALPLPAPHTYSRTAFEQQFRELDGDRTNSTFVLDNLSQTFTRDDLDQALASLHEQRLTRGPALRTLAQLNRIADCSYRVEFAADCDLAERVIMPRGPSESHGMEDVRLVRFRQPDASVDYVGTYTAYDGRTVAPQLLRTRDFRTFEMSQLSGPGAKNKGMALFPRQIGGRYVALSRADRESNAVTTSTDLHHWERAVPFQTPVEPWEVIQLGNCGPPIETTAGWLVLTHGVGTMREYSIGAVLLDLADPTRVIGRLRRPLLRASADERSGYVPNVVYSCGALLHGRTLVVPYGYSDVATRIALVALDDLLAELVPTPSRPRDEGSPPAPQEDR